MCREVNRIRSRKPTQRATCFLLSLGIALEDSSLRDDSNRFHGTRLLALRVFTRASRATPKRTLNLDMVALTSNAVATFISIIGTVVGNPRARRKTGRGASEGFSPVSPRASFGRVAPLRALVLLAALFTPMSTRVA